MFETGDYVVYGNVGVCKVDEIGNIDSPQVSRKRLYYTLNPIYSVGSTIFTPVDNEKVIMRPVITKEEALKLIDTIPSIELLWIADEKKREDDYKETLRKCDCREWVRVMKTIHLRKKSRQAENKKITARDEKYFRMAEDSLYGELAIALNMDKDTTKEYVIDRVEELETA